MSVLSTNVNVYKFVEEQPNCRCRRQDSCDCKTTQAWEKVAPENIAKELSKGTKLYTFEKVTIQPDCHCGDQRDCHHNPTTQLEARPYTPPVSANAKADVTAQASTRATTQQAAAVNHVCTSRWCDCGGY